MAVEGLTWQASLFGDSSPSVDPSFAGVRRVVLDAGGESWGEHVPAWVAAPDALFATLLAEAPPGQDSVAWHGDRVARDLPSALVAIVSLGGDRRFLLRPKGGGDPANPRSRDGSSTAT